MTETGNCWQIFVVSILIKTCQKIQCLPYLVFSKNRPLGRFFHRIAMSVALYPFHVIFFRLVICPPPRNKGGGGNHATLFYFYFFQDKSRNLPKIVSVRLSASVEIFFVSRMRDFYNVLIMCSQYTHKVFTIYSQCTHNVPSIYSQCTHNVLTGISQSTHNVLTMYFQSTHNVLTMYFQSTHNPLTMYS